VKAGRETWLQRTNVKPVHKGQAENLVIIAGRETWLFNFSLKACGYALEKLLELIYNNQ
jgi:hypothetical protein